MTFSWDVNVAALTGVIVLIILVVGHIIAVTIYLVKTNGTAHEAKERAHEAKARAEEAYQHAEEAHAQLAVISGSIALVREQFVKDDDLRHMEQRLATAINDLSKRLDQFLGQRPK